MSVALALVLRVHHVGRASAGIFYDKSRMLIVDVTSANNSKNESQLRVNQSHTHRSQFVAYSRCRL